MKVCIRYALVGIVSSPPNVGWCSPRRGPTLGVAALPILPPGGEGIATPANGEAEPVGCVSGVDANMEVSVMGWTDCHARKVILDTVLARARIDPAGPLLLDGLPDVDRLFGGADGVLLALHHRWATHLAAKLDQAIEHGDPPQTCWEELSSEQPTLRAVLDAAVGRSVALRAAQLGEQRMIDAHFGAGAIGDGGVPSAGFRAERVVRPAGRTFGGIVGWGQAGGV